MNHPIKQAARFWIAGGVVALAGVVVARGIAPALTGTLHVWMTVAGQLCAMAGIGIIAIGVQRRVHRTSPGGDAPPG